MRAAASLCRNTHNIYQNSGLEHGGGGEVICTLQDDTNLINEVLIASVKKIMSMLYFLQGLYFGCDNENL